MVHRSVVATSPPACQGLSDKEPVAGSLPAVLVALDAIDTKIDSAQSNNGLRLAPFEWAQMNGRRSRAHITLGTDTTNSRKYRRGRGYDGLP